MSNKKINQMKCKQCGYAHPVGTNCPPNNYRYDWINGRALVSFRGKCIAEANWDAGATNPKEVAATNGKLIADALNAFKPISQETPILLPNDTKIRFCNALDALIRHAAHGNNGECGNCDTCAIYLRHGDGDLCEKGKVIITNELCFADTNPS